MRGVKTLRTKLFIVLSIFAIISTSAIIYSFINIKDQKFDALLINLAGRQRALSQIMTKGVLGLYKTVMEPSAEDFDARKASYIKMTLKAKELFDTTLNSFIKGGVTKDGVGKSIYIPKVEDPAIQTELKKAKTRWDRFKAHVERVIKLADTPGEPKFLASVKYIENTNKKIFADMNKLTFHLQELSDRKVAFFKQILASAIALNFITLGVIIYLVHRMIIRRLRLLQSHMQDITHGNGDLTKRIDAGTPDEIGILGKEFNALLDTFQRIIQRLTESTSTLKESAERLNTTFASIVNGIDEQNKKTDQVATATEQMSAAIMEVARNTSTIAEMTKKANDATRQGEVCIKKIIDRINDISRSTSESVGVVTALGEQSQKIGNIIEVINEIADQTNLLALNAAIEAARAGEQGRGFAVVADEVRKLAERTTKATKEIYDMITGIQQESQKAVTSIKKEAKAVEEGVMLTNEVNVALGEITEHINTVDRMVQQIATTTEQQSTVSNNISTDMEMIASISRKSYEGVSGLTQLAVELEHLAGKLEEELAKFRAAEKQHTGSTEEEAQQLQPKPTLVVDNVGAGA